MFVLRALHSFASLLGNRKDNKCHLQPLQARAVNDLSGFLLPRRDTKKCVRTKGYSTVLLIDPTEVESKKSS